MAAFIENSHINKKQKFKTNFHVFEMFEYGSICLRFFFSLDVLFLNIIRISPGLLKVTEI